MSYTSQITSAKFNREHLLILNKINRKHKSIINKLKKHISTKGYYEDLGQKELRDFKDWLNTHNLSYSVTCQHYDYLSNDIDSL